MNHLRELRKNRSLTIKDVALKIGVTQNAISKYELGQRWPRPEIAKKIANLYGVSLGALQETDRQASCKYCHVRPIDSKGILEPDAGYPLIDNEDCYVELEKDEGLSVGIDNLGIEYTTSIKHCPKCGRYLGEEFGDE